MALDAVIYTRDDQEFEDMKRILQEEHEGIRVERDPMDGHGHYGYAYGIVVAAIDGARGMEIVLEWSKRYKKTPIIWITSDPDFAGMAIRRHIFDFIIRPYTESRFRDAVREAIRRAPQRDAL